MCIYVIVYKDLQDGSSLLKCGSEYDTLPPRTTVLQGGWPLFYIEWGWCWWTRNLLTSGTWWLLECSFWHCWHSYLRLSDNVLRHRKTTPNFDRDRVAILWISNLLLRSTPCGRLFLFCVLNIAYLAVVRKDWTKNWGEFL